MSIRSRFLRTLRPINGRLLSDVSAIVFGIKNKVCSTLLTYCNVSSFRISKFLEIKSFAHYS